MNISQILQEKAQTFFQKDLASCTDQELYLILLNFTKEQLAAAPAITGDKKLYYMSAEFLIGKLLSNNLINLGLYDEVADVLRENGHSMAAVEEAESEPSLGNGGLGRLAACFLDSIATLELPGDGVGLNYHFGLFHQKFVDNKQKELPDPWLSDKTWLTDTGKYYNVHFRDFDLEAHLYSIAVAGYTGKTNQLLLFDLDSVNEGLVYNGINFDKNNIPENLTLFLYPDDSDDAGRLLRVYQQYFLVSAGAQMILEDVKAHGWDLRNLSDHVVIQINDTHPSMVIPELIRLLMENGLTMKEAIAQTEKVCAYTNHTILAEALEKWPQSYLNQVAPQLMPVIQALDAVAGQRTKDESTAIIDQNGTVHMANMDIHFSKSTNGVAQIHTDILKNTELHNFYELYPEKFNNKTNGITHRRWLVYSNPQLTALLKDYIGDDFIVHPERLEDLMKYVDDPTLQERFMDVKRQRKQILADYVKETLDIDVNVDSIFDCQSKRLHAYKRQLLNIFHVMHLYLSMKKDPNFRIYPRTFFFSAKAAPSYRLAKEIIKLINKVARKVNNDPEISQYMKVVFIPNYSVSIAELLVNAADVSEQISTAGKEASGTGNMKYMMNGALTVGTLDGANVEIVSQVGYENAKIFGLKVEDIEKLKRENSYQPMNLYSQDPAIREVVDSLRNCTWSSDPNEFQLIYNDLMIQRDEFFVLADFEAYVQAQKDVSSWYQNRPAWARAMLVNIAKSGFFSSDRTIQQYADEIWGLKPIPFKELAEKK